jgi:hypothetical protein
MNTLLVTATVCVVVAVLAAYATTQTRVLHPAALLKTMRPLAARFTAADVADSRARVTLQHELIVGDDFLLQVRRLQCTSQTFTYLFPRAEKTNCLRDQH